MGRRLRSQLFINSADMGGEIVIQLSFGEVSLRLWRRRLDARKCLSQADGSRGLRG
jgi:hypothetical protein